MDDNAIIELFFARQEDAIKETRSKYGDFIRFIAFSITGILTEAEECENDTYLKLWKSIPPEKPEFFKAYIGKIVRNCALSCYRKNKAAKRDGGVTVLLDELSECIPDSTDIEEEYFGKQLSQLLSDWLKSLPEDSRALFIRRYWYCESVKAIAENTGMSPSKISSLLFGLRKQLKKELEKEGVTV